MEKKNAFIYIKVDLNKRDIVFLYTTTKQIKRNIIARDNRKDV